MKAIITGLLATTLISGTAAAEDHSLTVHIAGVRGDRGQVHVELYNTPETFRKSARALRVIQVPAQKDSVTV